jgi:hypothetical protein
VRRPRIVLSIHSSRPVGAKFHVVGRAWIQYSRFWPPGCGCGVPKVSLSTESLPVPLGGGAPAARAACLDRVSPAAARSASSTSVSETFSSLEPPTAHSSAAAEPVSRKARRSSRRLMRDIAADESP